LAVIVITLEPADWKLQSNQIFDGELLAGHLHRTFKNPMLRRYLLGASRSKAKVEALHRGFDLFN
jgi:hypothetical protein